MPFTDEQVDNIYRISRIAFWEGWHSGAGDMPGERDWATSDILLLLEATYGSRPRCNEPREENHFVR